MSSNDQHKQNSDDPLGLRKLAAIEPGYDGWGKLEAALLARTDSKLKWRRAGGWLALAASLVLAVTLVVHRSENTTLDAGGGSIAASDSKNISALIDLSQNMEKQVAHWRRETGSMPAESAIYVAELEDLIAQVDNQLSFTPDSVDLWGQRVNLLLDLAQIYQQQWQTDYGRMAAL